MMAKKDNTEFFEKAVEKDPGNTFAQYALAMEYYKAGRYPDAIAALEELLAHDPEYIPAYQMGGKVATAMNDLEKARELFRKGIDVANAAADNQAMHAASEMSEAMDEL